MELIQILLLFLVFISVAVSMFLRKLPALLALPIMAFLFPLIAGVSINDTVQYVLGEGSIKLSEAYTIAIFGSMLSMLLQKTGIAENFIKIGAELSGDKPWLIAFIMLMLITLLFTTLGGLGAIIMVASVVLPIMASVGVSPLTTVGIFLFGLSLGGTLNAGNWAVYTSVLGLSVGEVTTFALIMFGITFITALVYITIMLYKDGHDINFISIGYKCVLFILIAAVLYFSYHHLDNSVKIYIASSIAASLLFIKYTIGVCLVVLVLVSIYRAIFNKNTKQIHWISYFTPVIPLFLILIYNINFISAFIVGLLYGFIATYKKKGMNLLVRSIIEGGGLVMPAVALMLGIGMLLVAVLGPKSSELSNKVVLDDKGQFEYKLPAKFFSQKKGEDIIVKVNQRAGSIWKNDSTISIHGKAHQEVTVELKNWQVLSLLKPVFEKIVPNSALSFILIFILMSPLALYRGPLNVWGMGFGMAAIFLASGMPAGAIMGLLLSVGQIQGISDPTNTQNVWLANEMRVDVQKILWNTIPFTWLVAVLGLISAALIYMR